ncbi:hypothetical protein I309_06613 [Cryptococcus deuterogattii LA55]|nr:hypothetical protein I309_06613 [Cryptococcus deuterogattii LA55]
MSKLLWLALSLAPASSGLSYCTLILSSLPHPPRLGVRPNTNLCNGPAHTIFLFEVLLLFGSGISESDRGIFNLESPTYCQYI